MTQLNPILSCSSLTAGRIREHNSATIHVRETLTDKDGIFRIPSYSTIIRPFSWESYAWFIIFKPGYGYFLKFEKYPPGMPAPDMEMFFSAGIGRERLLNVDVGEVGVLKTDFKMIKTGIVELPALKTKEERRLSMPSLVGEEST